MKAREFFIEKRNQFGSLRLHRALTVPLTNSGIDWQDHRRHCVFPAQSKEQVKRSLSHLRYPVFGRFDTLLSHMNRIPSSKGRLQRCYVVYRELRLSCFLTRERARSKSKGKRIPEQLESVSCIDIADRSEGLLGIIDTDMKERYKVRSPLWHSYLCIVAPRDSTNCFMSHQARRGVSLSLPCSQSFSSCTDSAPRSVHPLGWLVASLPHHKMDLVKNFPQWSMSSAFIHSS